jgi:S1-C subfamily serine protease
MTVERTYIGTNYRSRLKVALVEPEGPAAQLGLQQGDLITAVRPKGLGAKTIGTPEDLAFLVSLMQKGDPMALEVWRDDDGDGQFERDEGYSELYQGTLELR